MNDSAPRIPPVTDPAARSPDRDPSTLRFGSGAHGAVPATADPLASPYRHGSGSAGNVAYNTDVGGRVPSASELGIAPWELKLYRFSFLFAVLYNTVWGTLVILFPRKAFEAGGLPLPDATGLLFWQCIGMFVLVYAAGYYYLWRDPIRYAPFALVATLGKIFGPIGWVWAYSQGTVPLFTGLTIVTNDLLWWPIWFPFVYKAVLRSRVPNASREPALPRTPNLP